MRPRPRLLVLSGTYVISHLHPIGVPLLTGSKYTLTITEVDNFVGGDGATKVKAMLVNGKLHIHLPLVVG